VRCPASFYRYLYTTIGAPYHWVDRLGWSDADIRAHLARHAVELWVMYIDGAPAGFFELRRDEEDGVEIAYFGLLPEFIGQGLGGFLLSEATARALSFAPRRVWLHTSSLDHPAALRNYRERGFRVIREERYRAEP
jgi:ribosomal protein S18 acetylase RimI-like enzyme